MTELKPFQKATVERILNAFQSGTEFPRFLVADEVGLGKTVVAQEVIRRMMENRTRPLVVIYMCSNLAIARQNKRKLLEVLDQLDRNSATCEADRLSLLYADPSTLPTDSKLHLYSFTPETSIPLRKRRRRGGIKDERALINALLELEWPGLAIRLKKELKGAAKKTWNDVRNHYRKLARRSALRNAFRDSLREEFGLQPRQHVARALDDVEPANIIAGMRNALAASSIEQLKPDLVIFDEFQRFRELASHEGTDERAQRVARRLRGEGCSSPQKLLLLSATPYRLYSRRWEDAAGEDHHTEFFNLVEFLAGGGATGTKVRKNCVQAFAQVEQHLRHGNLTSEQAIRARQRIEDLLSPMMARTERTLLQADAGEFVTKDITSDLTEADLAVFKHLSRSLNEKDRAAGVAYWTSIPLPMQMMGPHYRTWRGADKTQPPDDFIPMSIGIRDEYKTVKQWPHPRLRALREKLNIAAMQAPWLPPTSPWWPLGGLWQQSEARNLRKTLIFSRFRAVPPAIAAALSYEVDSVARRRAGDKIGYQVATQRRQLTASDSRHALLALFHPSPTIVERTDPALCPDQDLPAVRRHVQAEVRKILSEFGIGVSEKSRYQPLWKVIGKLDAQSMHWGRCLWAWKALAKGSRRDDEKDAGLGQLLEEWNSATRDKLETINGKMFSELVSYALSAPGVVVGRALKRHWEDAVTWRGFQDSLSVSWSGLRNYLDQRWFYNALRGRRSEHFPDAIQRAIIDGNLESVLDEHLWITKKTRGLKGKELANELLEGLTVKMGRCSVHPVGQKQGKSFSLRCHVAMPFTQTSSADLSNNKGKKIRADELRKAFNTPFWPFVLATTSVGQEGLDFHTWCDRLVHWDLCRNPADLEQREGRIQRFGGLAIRRAVEQRLRDKTDVPTDISTWSKIESHAESKLADASGLKPWWICENGNIERFVFSVPTSEQAQWQQWIKEQRLLYRLALGQPNQEDLLELMHSRTDLTPQQLHEAVINLSPWFSGNSSHSG